MGKKNAEPGPSASDEPLCNHTGAIHLEHRRRLKERYLKNGFDGFADHELIEMLLFFSKPQGDTNPTAHELMERFGSLKGILEASPEELCEVTGIGAHSAVLLKLIPELAKRYAAEETDHVTDYTTLSRIAQYFRPKFYGLDHECLYMMMFNNRMNLIDCIRVSEGAVNSSSVPIRLMTEKIIQKKASGVALAHNHPNGLAVPSSQDLEITDTLNNAFRLLDITLVEHLVFADNRFWPIMKEHFGMFRSSPLTGRVESEFYTTFYDLPDGECVLPSPFEHDPKKSGV